MMNYQVLARKWRPRSFQDMVGQEHILRMIANALEQQRIHHAYLFTGTRGVGKTTLARILAKCLNCESGVTANPCGTCFACTTIDAGQFLDLYEVDAASRTKVEDTRELLENVLYPPTQGRYKIYLIDEVHMLSNHSFNALLKTLEEPPEHVKFLLATTDPKRLPITILSRCLQFHLKRIPLEQITKHLQTLCEKENISYESPALERLAKAADGSMRDGLSILDQAIAYGHGKVNLSDVLAMLGSLAQDDVLPLLAALATQDGQQVFTTLNSLTERAPDFSQVLEELINLLHQIAIIQVVPQALTVSPAITELAKQMTAADVQLYYQIALLGRRDLSLNPNPQQGFEMTLLRMLALKPELNLTQPVTQAVKKIVAPSKPVSAPIPAPQVIASGKTTEASTEWRDILAKLALTGMAQALAANCNLKNLSDNKAILALAINHQPMLNPKLKDRIAEALSKHFNRPIEVTIEITTEEITTPSKQEEQSKQHQLAQATQTVMQNPKVKQLLDMYDATVEVSLVT